jgi:hypothetical protein
LPSDGAEKREAIIGRFFNSDNPNRVHRSAKFADAEIAAFLCCCRSPVATGSA